MTRPDDLSRPTLLAAARERGRWDLVVIGGGASGLGCAVDAASRGLAVLLLEARDFSSGTSSRSTKLIHGGVRYLAQGRLHLVREALVERARLIANAPHVVHPLHFVLPCISRAEQFYFGAGLKAYDVLAGAQGIGNAKWLGDRETRAALPNLGTRFTCSVAYEDGQFDDAALALSLLATFQSLGGVALNYCPVRSFAQEGGRIAGVEVEDAETGTALHFATGAVINAAGVWADAVRRLDNPFAAPLMRPSQGIHLVVDRSFVGGDSALLIPKTADGRVLFAIPWQGKTLLGTTDTEVELVSDEPRPLDAEVDYVLDTARQYLARAPQRTDILSAFAGLRPLVNAGEGGGSAQLSREHVIDVSDSGMLTLVGGKWTTYRRMAEDAMDRLLEDRPWRWRPTQTAALALLPREPIVATGDDSLPISDAFPDLTPAFVRRARTSSTPRAISKRTARRHRALFLDAAAAAAIVPQVARIVGDELGQDVEWAVAQASKFSALARQYALQSPEGGVSSGEAVRPSRSFFS
jgi:glycerol-3-phosphate dehydrogenase